MAGLLYKELIQNRSALHSLAIGFGFFSILMCIPVRDPDFMDEGGGIVYLVLQAMMVIVMFAINGALQQGLFEGDERRKWADFIASTPLSVRGQVLTKYYFALLMSIASLAYMTLLLSVNTVIQGRNMGTSLFLPVIVSIQLLMRSVEFPFLIRFGSRSSNAYRIALFYVIMMALLVYLMFGDLSIFGSFESFMDKATAWLNAGKQETALYYLLGILPIAAGVLYYLSYRLSCRLYWKGVECYDK